jgi:hypothetical protein
MTKNIKAALAILFTAIRKTPVCRGLDLVGTGFSPYISLDLVGTGFSPYIGQKL